MREGLIQRVLIAGFSLTCIMLLLLYIILKFYGETDAQRTFLRGMTVIPDF